MSQSKTIIQTLKKSLKTKGFKYKDVAEYLCVSESSVKRQFSQSDISLNRLEKICNLLEIEIADLIIQVENESTKLDKLTIEQESKIVSDTKLMLVAVAALNQLTFEDIYQTYQIEEPELIQALFELEKINLLKLNSGNKIKLLISHNFQWQTHGPIQTYFEDNIQDDFFDCQFSAPGDYRLVINGMLSAKSNQSIQNKMNKISKYFNELAQNDKDIASNRKFGSTLVLALRHWELNEFKVLRRDKDKKVFG